MLDGIVPLADNVLTNLMKIHYPSWYKKCISVKYPKKVYNYIRIYLLIYIYILIIKFF